MNKCKCGEDNLNNLRKSKLTKTGYLNLCKKCHNNNQKEYLKKNKDKAKKISQKQNEKRKQKCNNDLDFRIKEFASRFRNRSIYGMKNSKHFNSRKNLSIDFLVNQAKIALEKFPYMTFLDSKEKWKTASVDRIDSSKEYSEDNVRIVPMWLNSAKMNMSDKEFIEVIEHFNSKIKNEYICS